MFGANGIVTNGGWLTRGYTGHEHVPQVDLINMNGRMYDAVLGRMLSPDNFVGNPTSTQSYNRYSYVENNPLKYTDPSGWFLKAREEGREIAFPDVPHKGEEYGGCPGGFFNSSIFNYNFQGSYSSYVSNQGYYSFIYGTQTGMQAAVQAGYVQSKINLALSILTYSVTQKHISGRDNIGSAGEVKDVNINRTWTFGGDGGSGIDWGSATVGGGNMIGYIPNQGTISKPTKTFGDKIQGIPLLGGILDDIYVPTTRLTRMVGKPLFGDWYGETHINGEPANSDDAVMGLGSTALLLTGNRVLQTETGGLKQWVRIDKTYSQSSGLKTYGLKWGASPKYAGKIGNSWLRGINQQFRKTKLWWNSWRTADPGHWHWWKL